MDVEWNKRIVARVFEEAFNNGRLDVVDETVAEVGVDRQHSDEPSFPEHLKQVIIAMRTAFPDLHFDVSQMIGEGDWVAMHSVMTGTHTGELRQPLLPTGGPSTVPPTGRSVRVAHMHLIRLDDGQGVELWHVMDSLAMLGQLGLLPVPKSATA